MRGVIRLCSTSLRHIKYSPPVPLPSHSPSKTTPLLPKPPPKPPPKPLPQPSVNKE